MIQIKAATFADLYPRLDDALPITVRARPARPLEPVRRKVFLVQPTPPLPAAHRGDRAFFGDARADKRPGLTCDRRERRRHGTATLP